MFGRGCLFADSRRHLLTQAALFWSLHGRSRKYPQVLTEEEEAVERYKVIIEAMQAAHANCVWHPFGFSTWAELSKELSEAEKKRRANADLCQQCVHWFTNVQQPPPRMAYACWCMRMCTFVSPRYSISFLWLQSVGATQSDQRRWHCVSTRTLSARASDKQNKPSVCRLDTSQACRPVSRRERADVFEEKRRLKAIRDGKEAHGSARCSHNLWSFRGYKAPWDRPKTGQALAALEATQGDFYRQMAQATLPRRFDGPGAWTTLSWSLDSWLKGFRPARTGDSLTTQCPELPRYASPTLRHLVSQKVTGRGPTKGTSGQAGLYSASACSPGRAFIEVAAAIAEVRPGKQHEDNRLQAVLVQR